MVGLLITSVYRWQGRQGQLGSGVRWVEDLRRVHSGRFLSESVWCLSTLYYWSIIKSCDSHPTKHCIGIFWLLLVLVRTWGSSRASFQEFWLVIMITQNLYLGYSFLYPINNSQTISFFQSVVVNTNPSLSFSPSPHLFGISPIFSFRSRHGTTVP